MPTTPRDEVDPRLVDVVLALGMALAVAVLIAADFQSSGRSGPVAYLFAAGFGVLVLLRRRAARVMLVLTVLGVFTYYALGLPVIGIAFPAVAALYSAAEVGRTWWAAGSGVVLVAVAAYFRVIEGQPTTYLYGYELLTNIALAAASVALGVAVRRTRETRRYAQRVRLLTEAEQAQQADRRLQAERVRLARDLHDAVGHSLSVVSLHSGVAAEAVGHDDTAAREALERVREATAASLRELRTTVKLLRTPGTDEAPPGSLVTGGVETLLRPVQAAGLAVEADIDLPAGAIDTAVDAAAYRIVQEALTNVVRHAGARRVRIGARLDGDRLRLQIADDGHGLAGTGGGRPTRSVTGRGVATGTGIGTGTGASNGAGQGLAGMRERAALLGGTLQAADRPEGGFLVSADLPTRLSP